jgi:hypothetical protein
MRTLAVKAIPLVLSLLGAVHCGPNPSPGSGGAGGTAGTAGTGGSGGGSTFPPVSDFGAPGPYEAVTVNTTGPGNAFTLFRPAQLGQGGVRHPIITWGNGTFVTPEAYAAFLTHLATHGFVVIASNNTNTGSGVQMLQGVDWLLQQNAAASGDFAGKLDPNRIGATGHSQGGGGTINAGADPRIKTVVPIQPLPQTQRLNGPMLLLCGKEDTTIDPITLCQNGVYIPATVPTFFGIVSPVNHFTPLATAGVLREPITAWFRLHLMGDESARSSFYGPSCKYCTDANWQVQRKGI